MKLAKYFAISTLVIILSSIAVGITANFIADNEAAIMINNICETITKITLSSIFMMVTIVFWKEIKGIQKISFISLSISTIVFMVACTFPQELNAITVLDSEVALISFGTMLLSAMFIIE